MKLRCRPEDFVVEEECRLVPEGSGPYILYRMRKRGLTTPEAVGRAARLLKVEPGRVRFCGLKDRHARTTQFITVLGRGGDGLRIGEPGVELEPLGRSARPAGPSEIVRNRFEITLRDVAEGEAEGILVRAAAYSKSGIPNYFDEQRYGSARATGEFPGEAAARGDYEGALRLILARSSREDPREVRERRQTVDRLWGKWAELKAALDRSSERSIITYLTDHPTNFAGAFDRLPESLRTMALSAFQSLIWNECLSAAVLAAAGEGEVWELTGRYDTIRFFQPGAEVADHLRGISIPFPHRSFRSGDARVAAAFESALERRGLTTDSFRLRGLKKSYFYRGERAALAEVEGFSAEGPSPDELHPGRFKVCLRFALPPGAYATMFVKAAAGPG